MRFTKLLFLLCVFLSSCLISVADTFIVTSNADSGPGTLREAITLANANGITVTDYIHFNISDLSISGRTITLVSALPALSSNLELNASTQPGSKFGVSDTKIIIEHISNASDDYRFALFDARNVSDLAVYGFYLRMIFTTDIVYNNTYALLCNNTKRILVGAPGKGNIFCGWGIAIGQSNYYMSLGSVDSFLIKSNFFGLSENGDSTRLNPPFDRCSVINLNSIIFEGCKNIEIGGSGTAEGNYINYIRNGIVLNKYEWEENGSIRIIGNRVGTNFNGTVAQTPLSIFGTGIHLLGVMNAQVLNNHIMGSGNGLKLIGCDRFKIQGNILGLDYAGKITSSVLLRGIETEQGGTLSESYSGSIIGGSNPGETNIIASTKSLGIFCYNPIKITISKNSIFCNTDAGIALFWLSRAPEPFITINSIIPGEIRGTAPPLAIIELFLDDSCVNCEGKQYLATVLADASGDWIYNSLPVGGAIVATATDTTGATSGFSRGSVKLDSVKIRNATCGRTNGSITGIKITSGTYWRWEDENGILISTDSVLNNVAAGKYRLIVGIGNNSCISRTPLYEIKELPAPVFDIAQLNIQHPSCGLINGQIQFNVPFNSSWEYQLLDSQNIVIIPNIEAVYPVTSLLPGNYSLRIRLKEDSTCPAIYPFILIAQPGPTLSLNNANIINTTCEINNGSITGIVSSQVTGTPFIRWYDSTGNIVGSTLDLLSMPAGKYRLKFKDGSPCDTIISPYYTIVNNGAIILDSSHVQIKPSGCQLNNGSIRGMQITGATSFEWINTLTGSVVSTTSDLQNMGAGSYRLVARNNIYGCSVQSRDYTITNATPLLFQIARVDVQEAQCNLDNASITIHPFITNSIAFSFHWLKDSTSTVGTGLSLRNMGPGRYQCIAIDTNGCQQQVYAHTVIMMPLPIIDESRLVIKADTCNLSVGSVSGITITSDNPSITYAWNNALNQKIGSSQSVQKIPAGSYYLIGTDIRQCTVRSNEFTVGNVTRPPQSPSYKDVIVPKGASVSIEPIAKVTGSYSLFTHSAGGSPLHTNNNGQFTLPAAINDTAFYIELTQGDCVSARTRVNVKVVNETKIVVPNAFTPNNDGKNDDWGIRVFGIVNLRYLRVFNRWGQMVYESSNPDARWKGTLNGRALPSGTYAWSLSGTDYFNKPIQQSGTVTIIR